MKKVIINLIFIFVSITNAIAQVPAYLPTNGLVGWWPFNGNANDESGNGNNGTVNGAVLTNDRASNNNKAYSFDGVNDQINVNHSSQISPNQFVSINTWIYPRAYENNKHIISKGSHVNLYYRSYGIIGPETDNKIKFFICNGSSEQYLASTANLILNQWAMITSIYDGISMKIFINGVLDSQVAFTGNINQNTEPLVFGSHIFYSPSDYWFDGKIDDIGIWNRALTACEINQLYTSGVSPIVASSTSSTICAGSTSTLTASGATSYTWMPGNFPGTSLNVAPSVTTIYTVTGTNANGCTNTATTSVAVNALPVVTAARSASAVCAGNSVTLSGGGASTYVWSDGVTNAVSFIPTTNKTYTVTGTDANGCSKTATTSVVVNSLPVVTAASSTSVVCAGGSVILTGGGASGYIWSDGVTNAISFVPTNNATYTVTGTDVNGCSKTATTSVVVNSLPVVTAASSASVVCAGGSVILTGGGASGYVWSDGVTNAVSFIPTTNKTYTVTGTDANGCSKTATTSIVVNALPVVTAASSATAVCAGQTVVLTANGATNYMWTNGPNTSTYTVNPLTNATYTVEGLDNNNCFNASSITISVTANPTVSAIASSTAICAGQTVTLTANGASTYTWLPSGSVLVNEIVAPTVNTTYSLSGISNGCSGNANVQIIVNQLPTISVSTSNSLICVGESVVLSASSNATSYLWSNSATTMSISITPTTTTIYSITVSDGVCSASSSITQNVSACTAVNDIHENNRVLIYPNPFTNSFEVKWDFNASSDKKMLMNVYNVLGEIILSTTISENNTKINTNEWRNGSYFVKINNQVYKIIKQ